MAAGGVNPTQVRDAIATGLVRAGVAVTYEIVSAVIENLHAGGYRIARAGHVAKLDELEHTISALDLVKTTLEGTDHDHDFGTGAAIDSITLLREISLNTLGVLVDDVDEPPTMAEMVDTILARH